MTRYFSPLSWSFPVGTWSGTRVAVSVYFPLAVLVLCLQMQTWWYGLLAGMFLLLSSLAHEIAHVWVARATGGWGDDILVWPLGGLLHPQPALDRRSRVMTALAGPAVNGVLCLLAGIAVWRMGLLGEAINPLKGWPILPSGEGTLGLFQSAVVVLFIVNWVLLVINLIPVHPFDGGRVLECGLSGWLVEETANYLHMRLGAVAGVSLMIAGLLADHPGWHGTWVVCLGAVVLVLNLQEVAQRSAVDDLESALLDYELALDDVDGEFDVDEPDPGLLERWRQHREETRLLQEEKQQQEAERRVDVLLKKVHHHGFEALSEAEKRQLRQASQRYRDQAARSEETI